MVHFTKAWLWLSSRQSALITALVCAAFVIQFAPYSHNPDGNFYFGTALRVSQGNISSSVEGFYSPLLSWLMAPLIALGIAIPLSFRIVSTLALIATIFLTVKLGERFALRPEVNRAAALLLILHLSYFSVALVTSDLLTVPFVIASILVMSNEQLSPLRRGVLAGSLAGVAYYSKAIQLPILLSTFGVIFASSFLPRCRLSHYRRIALYAAASCAMTSLPWIVILSRAYGTPIISAQQLQLSGTAHVLDYSPVGGLAAELQGAPTAPDSLKEARPFTERLNSRVRQSIKGIQYFLRVTIGLLFGPAGASVFGFFCFVGMLSFSLQARASPARQIGLITALVHIALYMAVWGAYIRYYFPILPIVYLAFFHGAAVISDRADALTATMKHLTAPRLRSLITVIIAIALISMANSTIRSIYADISEKDDAVIKFAASLPLLNERSGILTGNGDSPYPGLIAYTLKREYWGSIFPRRSEDVERIAEKLRQWKIDQVIWFGAPYPPLDAVPELRRHGPFQGGSTIFYIYNLDSPALETEKGR